jgi:ABC-type nickel/cobalt efflux system permease component RcnA
MALDKIILLVALGLVAVILAWGVLTMARGGEYNVKNSNRIMRYRIIFQAIALLVIMVLIWMRQGAYLDKYKSAKSRPTNRKPHGQAEQNLHTHW